MSTVVRVIGIYYWRPLRHSTSYHELDVVDKNDPFTFLLFRNTTSQDSESTRESKVNSLPKGQGSVGPATDGESQTKAP
jgi:hypothetical protein